MRTAAATLNLLALAAVSTCPEPALARVTLPAILSDGMVLQQHTEAALWGRTDRGEVAIVTSWDHERYTARADRDGNWLVHVRTPGAGGPHQITVDDGEQITLSKVMVGEVWLASGQSNMGFPLSSSAGAGQAAASAHLPEIRYFDVKRQLGDTLMADAPGSVWLQSTPKSARSFSAVAFYFARELHRTTGLPVGIIHASWGGTPAEAWTPRSTLEEDPRLRVALDRWTEWERDAAGRQDDAGDLARFMIERPHREPGTLFAGMINPVVPYTVKGFLWYQGESNVRWAGEYEYLLGGMIRSWRERWRTGQKSDLDLPFFIVELAPHGYSDMEDASLLREAQWEVAEDVCRSGVVTTIDLGDMNDIHPTRKQEIGERLARLALARSYGADRVVHSGPAYRRATLEGNRVRIDFDHTQGGLKGGGAELSGFEVSSRSEPTVFRKARAGIEGRTVVVWSDEVREPASVRYGWGDEIASYSLFNGAGLPAAPFRTGTLFSPRQ